MAPTRWAERWAALLGWRWALWGALCLLVGLLLAALVFLAREYEDGLALSRQERSAADIAADVRSGLVRNLQDLIALHSTVPAVDDWPAPAARLLPCEQFVAFCLLEHAFQVGGRDLVGLA